MQIKNITFNYEPSESQKIFHSSPQKFKLFGGAMAGGKSFALCAELIMLSLENANNNVLLTRKSLKDLKRTTLITLFDLLPNEAIASYNKTEGLITLVNGSQIILSDLQSREKLKSLNLGAFAIDEASETNEEMFLMLSSRLRRSGIKKYFGLFASNPEPGWLKKRFIDQKLADHLYIPALPKDNKYLPVGYIEAQEATMPLVWREKYLLGRWDIHDQQIISAADIIPSTPQELNDIFYKVMTVDPAISEKDSADETSITVLGIDRNNIIHELETIHGNWGFNEQIRQIDACHKRHKPDLMGVETVAYQLALFQVLKEKGYAIIELKADRDKMRRLISVSHYFTRQHVRINHHKTQQQLIEFPKGDHDDLVDSLVYGIHMVKDYALNHFKKIDDKLSNLDARSKNFWKTFKDDSNPNDNFNNFYLGT